MQKQSKRAEQGLEPLVCTYGKCKRLQTEDGEFCEKHYPIHYGDYGNKEDEELIKMREELMDYIEKGKTEVFINKFHELLEVERELTLREDK